MHAIILKNFGDSDALTLSEAPRPQPAPHQLLIRVRAFALNRADLLQRRGKYPPPAGESDILGLEVAGEIEALGAEITQFQRGEKVFGLVPGGGYAEYCLMDAGLAMPIPSGFSFEEAAAIPEAFLTANEALFTLGDLRQGNTVLIHAGASGVGSAAIQLAHQAGATVYTTVGNQEKKDKVLSLGVDDAINYKQQDFADFLEKHKLRMDVIVDFIGANYLKSNLQSLKKGGRLICVGLMGGAKAELDLNLLLFHYLQIKGLIMRTRSLEEKRAITRRFCERWLPLLETRKIFPVIDSIYPAQEVKKAHDRMEQNANIGKIILTWD